MSRTSHGFPSMGRGVRIPFGDPELDKILSAIQSHSDFAPSPSVSDDPEVLISRYGERDEELYEILDALRGRVAERWPHVLCHEELLEAIERHSVARRPKQASDDVSDLLNRYEERDAELYDRAAALRCEATIVEAGAGVYFDKEGLEALREGRKTVMRVPVEFDRFGKPLFAHYEPGGGIAPTYPIYGPGQTDECELVTGLRLSIVSIEPQSLQPITDAEARLEGYADRAELLRAWEQRHGEFPLTWLVHRYEIEPVEA